MKDPVDNLYLITEVIIIFTIKIKNVIALRAARRPQLEGVGHPVQMEL